MALARWFEQHQQKRYCVRSTANLDIPCIVIGGQSFGGCGKTPTIAWLAEQLKSDCDVSILLRPTRKAARHSGLITTMAQARDVGDEAAMLWRRFQNDVKLFVDRDLVSAQQAAWSQCDVMLVDDGLRTVGLKCSVSIITVDVELGGKVFPGGAGRVSLDNLPPVDIVWGHKCDEEHVPPGFRCDIESRYRFSSLRNRDGLELSKAEVNTRPVTLVSGIARPSSFHRTATSCFKRVRRIVEFSDHENFKFPQPEVDGELIVTTEKDLFRGAPPPFVYALCVDLEIMRGLPSIKRVLQACASRRHP